MLSAVVPGPDGSLRDELRAGIAPPAQAERESWARLPPGEELLRAVGARPAYPGAGAEYYERNGADTSLEINAIHAGEHRTVVPAVAHASVSQRLAPGQSARDALATLERLLRDALPAGAELELSAELGEPSLFPPDNPAIALSAQALERAVGAPTAFVRSGGSIPVVAEFAARDIPTVVSGFGLEDDAYHAPDESFRLVALDQGAAARERALPGAGRALTSVGAYGPPLRAGARRLECPACALVALSGAHRRIEGGVWRAADGLRLAGRCRERHEAVPAHVAHLGLARRARPAAAGRCGRAGASPGARARRTRAGRRGRRARGRRASSLTPSGGLWASITSTWPSLRRSLEAFFCVQV